MKKPGFASMLDHLIKIVRPGRRVILDNAPMMRKAEAVVQDEKGKRDSGKS